MKTKQFILVTAIMLLFAGMGTLMAQQGNGCGKGMRDGGNNGHGPEFVCQNIPDLTDQQQAEIKKLQTAHIKEMQALHNKMGELKAKERTLATTDNADMNAINANIDEITKTQNTIMKKKAAHRADVRKLLTDDQKVWFDAHMGHGKGMGPGKGMGHGKGQGRGAGNGPRCING